MAQSFLIIGLGRFGVATADTLRRLGHQVMVVDSDEERINAVKDRFMHAMQCDTTDERVIKALGVADFDAVVVSIGSDLRASILTTLLCVEQGARFVVAKAQDEIHVKLLEKVGAHKVMQPEKIAGERLARSLCANSIIDTLELTEDQSVTEMGVPKPWLNRTIGDVNVRHNYGVSVIAIRKGARIVSNIMPETAFEQGDILLIVGDNATLDRIARMA